MLLVLVGAAAVSEHNEWVKFYSDHNCHKIAEIDGDVFNTIGMSGNGQMTVGIGSTPKKIGYLCNDGITYYRDI